MLSWLIFVPLAAQAPPRYHVVIRHGTVFDGSGLSSIRADIGIVNDRIVKVGDLTLERGLTEIDATGLFVAPGFINIHSHASANALPTAENMLTQGVTTEIVNPDGGGSPDIAGQLARMSAAGLAVNIGAYVGFNAIWAAVMGPTDRRATPADIDRMRALVSAGLDTGAWGVSAGLDYKPAYYAQVEEVVRALEPAAKWRTNFPNHDRLTPESGFSSRIGVGETIAIGERAGLVPVVTHMKAQGSEQGTAATLLGMMQQATTRGAYTAADVYPYLAGQTGLGALLVPAWAQDGGRDQMLQRFADPAQRTRIVTEIEQAMSARFGGPAGVYLPQTKQELTDVMKEMQVSAGEAVIRILERSNVSAILRFGSEPDLIKILQNPTSSIACDCGASTETRQHPRAFGTFPRVLGRYVREQQVLAWEDAVRKMTALPAATIGMVDRGWLVPGMMADVTAFDPVTVIDHATYEDPGRLSEGIRFVLVNGRVVLRDGKVTGDQAGRVLSRDAHMPSRPMTTDAKRVRSIGKIGGTAYSMTIDLTQPARAPRAKGSIRVTNVVSGEVLEALDVGVVQTAKDWASVTAALRSKSSGEIRGATIVVESADPFVDGHPRSVTIDVEGKPRISGVLQ